MQLAAWKIEPDGPVRSWAASVELEADLERWIEGDPTMVLDGLRVVGRQVVLEGGRLDLLGVDPQERWIVVEIKRGKLYRDALTQALDYASSISTMPHENLAEIVQGYATSRDEDVPEHPAIAALSSAEGELDGVRPVGVVVVGIGKDPSLERLVEFLGDQFGVPIQVVSFEAFDLGEGKRLLIREVRESESVQPVPAEPDRTVEAVVARAAKRGADVLFEILLQAAERNGLYARPFKYSIMFTPPSNRNRMLFTIWFQANSPEIRLYKSTDAFTQFFSVSGDAVESLLGSDGERFVRTPSEAQAFANGLDRLLGDSAPETP